MSPLALIAAIVLALLIFQWLQKRGQPVARPMALQPPAPALRQAPLHLWTRSRSIPVWTEGGTIQGEETWSVDLREMTLTLRSPASGSTTAFLLRRASPTAWETKLDPKWREEQRAALESRIASLQDQLAGQMPADGADRHEELEKLDLETELASAREKLEGLSGEPSWRSTVVPEEFVASIETAYQRYLAQPA